ncbi:hypothetical protein RvY_02313 [Ramazzottius varieornatus]|uniref:Uncharacterized protein n=1 Tax=Ramazzottius varieornatus TaxID=947166 RepID=A0A1D1UN19_RAMVA|nr:hypothetical protein RvY_02313 [Ramazzottius varieornatus]
MPVIVNTSSAVVFGILAMTTLLFFLTIQPSTATAKGIASQIGVTSDAEDIIAAADGTARVVQATENRHRRELVRQNAIKRTSPAAKVNKKQDYGDHPAEEGEERRRRSNGERTAVQNDDNRFA